MHQSTRIIAAATAAGFVAFGASAFTATSTVDDAAINVGSVAQTVSGATITNVAHTYTDSTDTTTAISAKAEQLLSTATGVVKVSINSGTAQNCTVTVTDLDLDGVDDGVSDYSDLACDITDVANVTNVRFIVNG
ncbi:MULTISPECIES: hypothetical protein [Nocardioides]|uniref:Uncharacterized protein n=1 Tax=Nocardioides vastitatis TaxID=2568655 RepID=A0ABW0ZN27_9ACTN|nr:hypothetical protein [Nocardioides sp.]THI96119.1 hypothetical protein E7Z54_17590 [Nocardioides sp.]